MNNQIVSKAQWYTPPADAALVYTPPVAPPPAYTSPVAPPPAHTPPVAPPPAYTPPVAPPPAYPSPVAPLLVYTPPVRQNDMMSAYDERLCYEMAKAEVDLRKGQIANQQRSQLQWDLENIKLQYKTYMAMLGATVYKDNFGNLMFAISDERGAKISSKRLLNVKNFRSEILVSEVPEKNEVLHITWEGNENTQIFLPDLTKGISPNAFLNKLKGHGVLFTVSGRTEKKAAEALLAYSIEEANITEISACYGWCRKGDGNWHFADEDEITMRRILNDEK